MSGNQSMHGGKPRVSVVIPTYNRWPLARQTIDSVLAQDYRQFEVIVVDDGSTDQTQEELPKRYEDHVIYVRQRNRGPSAARNAGIEMARGEYVAFLDSDDLWMPDKLSSQVVALDGGDAGFTYCTCLEATADGKPTRWVSGDTNQGVDGCNLKAMLEGHPIMTSAVMIRRDVLSDVGAFDERILSGHDTDLWLRMAAACPGHFVSKPLVLIRQHPGRWSHQALLSGIRARGYVRTYRKLLNSLPDEKECLRPLVWGRLVQAEFQVVSTGKRELSWERLNRALTTIMARRWEKMDTIYPYKGLADALLRWSRKRGGVKERHVSAIIDALRFQAEGTPCSASRRIALFCCALTRAGFYAEGHHIRIPVAMRAARHHWPAFYRHVLRDLPRAAYWLLRDLLRGS